jgi:hypothetical protein
MLHFVDKFVNHEVGVGCWVDGGSGGGDDEKEGEGRGCLICCLSIL